VRAAAREIGRDYVISLKPCPSVLAAAKGCNVEIVLNSISTVQRQPQRLWQWMEVATEVASRQGNP
jgi:hypothetical protein